MSNNLILICTVGGSHEPIVKSIQTNHPDYVCFVCTGKDPGTAQPGSDQQIIGKGNVIKASVKDQTAALPNIPTQVGLAADQFECLLVPADDLDQTFIFLQQRITDLKARFPGTKLLANYTGGTKSMSAALVIVALGDEDVELTLVTGNRANLVKVQQGTEHSVPATVETIRLSRAMAPFLQAWNRFAFDEAHDGLNSIREPRNRQLRTRLCLARDLSKALVAWDRFDHTEAWGLFKEYKQRIAPVWKDHIQALEVLTGGKKQQTPARLYDLLHNAQRRAHQKRFDDAVARVYRLIEWTAQWLLKTKVGLDTSDLDPARLPQEVSIPARNDGKYQAGLFNAWSLVQHLIPGSPPAEFFRKHSKTLKGHLQMRNDSILAHGFNSVAQNQWDEFHGWLEAAFLPMFQEVAAEDGLKKPLPQLPSDLEPILNLLDSDSRAAS